MMSRWPSMDQALNSDCSLDQVAMHWHLIPALSPNGLYIQDSRLVVGYLSFTRQLTCYPH